MNIKVSLLLIASILFSSCCDDIKKKVIKENQQVAAEKVETEPVPQTSTSSGAQAEFRIENIRKVFVHKPGGYSILWENENKELIAWEFDYYSNTKSPPFIKERRSGWSGARISTRVINDIEGNDSMWGVIRYYNDCWFEVDLHIKIDEIGGGSFKYREGKTDKTGSTGVIK